MYNAFFTSIPKIIKIIKHFSIVLWLYILMIGVKNVVCRVF
ncbi:putative membrane protein [Helicobacter pylori R036d]|uniref:Putative membrane protein n=1 Tax=Helicobacter pylori R036d TaxID=1145113 RepID=K2KRF5_HELPX|nr:putative membrane protein [Helicobacter pylori R036d]